MMNPFRHYPNDKDPRPEREVHRTPDPEPAYPRKDPPARVETETGEHIMEERQRYRRAEDIARADIVERVQNAPLTIKVKHLVWMAAGIVSANQAFNAWRDKNVTRDQFDKLAASVQALSAKFDQWRNDDNFKNYSICVQMKVQNPEKYPRFCDREEIQQFNPSR